MGLFDKLFGEKKESHGGCCDIRIEEVAGDSGVCCPPDISRRQKEAEASASDSSSDSLGEE